MDDTGTVPAPTDAAVTDNSAPAPAPVETPEQAFADQTVDEQLAALLVRVEKLEAAALPAAPAPTADPDAAVIGNLHDAIARLYKHIFGEVF